MSTSSPAVESGSADAAGRTARRRIAIVGGGITGLAAAWELKTRLPAGRPDRPSEIVVFDDSVEPGGVLGTESVTVDGVGTFAIERAADMFTTAEPDALALCQEIGFADELISTNPSGRRALIVHRGRLIPVPDGFALMEPRNLPAVLATPLLSPAGKARLLAEALVPRRANADDPGSDESLAGFAIRRFGRQAFERLIQPLVGGIYTADPERLSLRATLPRFLDMEAKHGSITRAVLASKRSAKVPPSEGVAPGSKPPTAEGSGARYGLFLAPRGGFGSLIVALQRALAAETPEASDRGTRPVEVRLHAGTPVDSLRREASGWRVSVPPTSAGSADGRMAFDAVILACGAPRAATLLAAAAPTLASAVGTIEAASSAVVVHGVRETDCRHKLDAFGFVCPRTAGRKILAASFASRKFPGRAPDGTVLIRTFVGGALQPELLSRSDEELDELVRSELGELIGWHGSPLVTRVIRWNRAMPQYWIGHLDRVAAIEAAEAEVSGLAVAGAYLRGVGLPLAIRSGRRAAGRIAAACVDAT